MKVDVLVELNDGKRFATQFANIEEPVTPDTTGDLAGNFEVWLDKQLGFATEDVLNEGQPANNTGDDSTSSNTDTDANSDAPTLFDAVDAGDGTEAEQVNDGDVEDTGEDAAESEAGEATVAAEVPSQSDGEQFETDLLKPVAL